MKRLFLGVLIAVTVAAAGWEAYRRIAASSSAARPDRSAAPVAIETQPIRKGQIRDIGVFTGSLIPKSQFVIAPKVAGWLK
jgi:hypothetical protein